jgi:hypothetical protein
MVAWSIEWQAEDVGEESDGPPCRAPARCVVQDDGDGTPPLAAGTVYNTCLIKNLVRR